MLKGRPLLRSQQKQHKLHAQKMKHSLMQNVKLACQTKKNAASFMNYLSDSINGSTQQRKPKARIGVACTFGQSSGWTASRKKMDFNSYGLDAHPEPYQQGVSTFLQAKNLGNRLRPTSAQSHVFVSKKYSNPRNGLLLNSSSLRKSTHHGEYLINEEDECNLQETQHTNESQTHVYLKRNNFISEC